MLRYHWHHRLADKLAIVAVTMMAMMRRPEDSAQAHFTLIGSREQAAMPSSNERFYPIRGGGVLRGKNDCLNYDAVAPPRSVAQSEQFKFEIGNYASHVGMCTAALYDARTRTQVVALGEQRDCVARGAAMTVAFPANAGKLCEECVIKISVAATHQGTSPNVIEYYDSCVDIAFAGAAGNYGKSLSTGYRAPDTKVTKNDAATDTKVVKNDSTKDSKVVKNDSTKDSKVVKNDSVADSKAGKDDSGRKINDGPTLSRELPVGTTLEAEIAKAMEPILTLLMNSYDSTIPSASSAGSARLGGGMGDGKYGADLLAGDSIRGDSGKIKVSSSPAAPTPPPPRPASGTATTSATSWWGNYGKWSRVKRKLPPTARCGSWQAPHGSTRCGAPGGDDGYFYRCVWRQWVEFATAPGTRCQQRRQNSILMVFAE